MLVSISLTTVQSVDAFRPRNSSFVLAALLHVLLVVLAVVWSLIYFNVDDLSAGVRESIELNEKQRIIRWYRLEPIPQIRNPDPSITRNRARGERHSENEIVVDRPNPISSKQLIEQQDSSKLLRAEIPAPNAVRQSPSAESAAPAPIKPLPPRRAQMPAPVLRKLESPQPLEAPPTLAASSRTSTAVADLALPSLPKPRPRKFVAPAMDRQAPPARTLDFSGIPEFETKSPTLAAGLSNKIEGLAKPAPKKFVPPSSPAKLTSSSSVDMTDVPTLDLQSSKALSSSTGLPGQVAQLPKLASKRFVPPDAKGTGQGAGKAPKAMEAPPQLETRAGTGTGGKDRNDLVSLSVKPSFGPPPTSGNLPGSFSQAREIGAPAHVANTTPGVAVVSGVSTNPAAGGGRPAQLRLPSPEELLGEAVKDEYFEVRFDIARQFPRLALPLAPSSRTLPRRIEGAFAGRRVFVVVVPMDGVERYAGDWIIWFAEKNGAPAHSADNVKMTPPLPLWKLETRRGLTPGKEKAFEVRVQVRLVINQEGRLTLREIIGRNGTQIDSLVANDLQRWVFQPARLEGQVIDIEVIAEIPYRFPLAFAENTTIRQYP